MAVVLRSLALLGAAGASFALFIQELLGGWLEAFIRSNSLSLINRQRLLGGMVGGAAAAVAIGLLVWNGDSRRLHRIARLAAPLILLGFLPPLSMPAAWSNPLNAALVIAAVLLLAERLFRVAFAAGAETPWIGRIDVRGQFPSWVGRRLPAVLVGLGVIGYAVYFSVFTLYMHGRFQTYGYDLGQYDNIFWSTLHGYPLRDGPLNLTKNWHELRNHAELSVFFFIPFYAIRPGGAILVVIQSCVLALGAVPLYRFASRRLPRSYAAALALVYLLYPPMHGLQFYDFHFQPIASTFVLAVIDFVDERRYVLCAIAFLVAVGCREDIPVGLAMLGAFLALSGYRVKPGIVISVAATFYFVLMRFVIMPSFGSWYFQGVYQGLLPEGAPSFGGIIATMLSNPSFTFVSLLQPDKLRYMLQILAPVAFLPIRRGYLVLSIIPGSIFTILTTQYAPTIDIGFQYSAHFIPYIFAASVLALVAFGRGEVGRVRRQAAILTVILGTVLCGIFWGAIPPRTAVHGGFSMMTMKPPTAADRRKDHDLKELNALIPKQASVAVSEPEMPHISRLEMRSLRDTTDADYLLYGVGGGWGSANADRVIASGEFERVAERPGLALARRKNTTPPWPGTPAARPPAPPAAPAAPPAAPVAPPAAPAVRPAVPVPGSPLLRGGLGPGAKPAFVPIPPGRPYGQPSRVAPAAPAPRR
jgi:uncharacterized membrane protein